jgi:hypothetical protein
MYFIICVNSKNHLEIMKKEYLLSKLLVILFLCFIVNISVGANEKSKHKNTTLSIKVIFDKDKWLEHEGDYYPYRDKGEKINCFLLFPNFNIIYQS